MVRQNKTGSTKRAIFDIQHNRDPLGMNIISIRILIKPSNINNRKVLQEASTKDERGLRIGTYVSFVEV